MSKLKFAISILNLALFLVLLYLALQVYKDEQAAAAADRSVLAERIEALNVALTGTHGIRLKQR